MNWNLYLNFLATMLAIVNPVGIWPIWSELTRDASSNTTRRQIAALLVLVSFLILTVFLISGKYLLQFFSIDLPVFKIAGGILLLNTGMSMIKGSATELTDREEREKHPCHLPNSVSGRYLYPWPSRHLQGQVLFTTIILYSTNAQGVVDHLVLTGVNILDPTNCI